MKTYTFKLVIKEGCDEFWEGIKETGCDEVLQALTMCLNDQAWLDNNGQLTLQKFEDEDEA